MGVVDFVFYCKHVVRACSKRGGTGGVCAVWVCLVLG